MGYGTVGLCLGFSLIYFGFWLVEGAYLVEVSILLPYALQVENGTK